MSNPFLLALLSLLNPVHIQQLTADAVNEYATIAHGEGGIDKVLSAAKGLIKLVEDAAGVVNEPAPPTA